MGFRGNAMCASFKRELLEGQHDFRNHTFKLALYTSAAELSEATTDYSSDNEVTGAGYTAGGVTLVAAEPSLDGTVALSDFEDVVIPSATLTARGALIYNSTAGGTPGTTNAVAVLDFGSDRKVSGQDLTIRFPSSDGLNAIIRIT